MKAFFKSYWPTLLLIALVLLFLGDVCFGGKILFMRDLFNGDLWSRVISGEAIRHGQFRLWFSFVGGGFPYAANPYMGECYPPNWLFALPATEVALRLWWVFHLSVAAVSFYLLGRHWKLQIAPALFGAVSFAFSTFVISWMEFAQAISCLVWGPLVLLAVSVIIERTRGDGPNVSLFSLLQRNAALIAGLAVLIALQIVASGEFFYYTALFSGAYAVSRWVSRKDLKGAKRAMAHLCAAGALGVALAAPHLLPAMELLPYTDRVGEVDALTTIDSAHARQWFSMLLPFLYGVPGYPNAYWATQIYEFAFGTVYVGVLPLIAMFFAASYLGRNRYKSRLRFLVLFFGALGLFSMAMSMGECTPLYGAIHHWFPGFAHFRYPTKFFLFVTYAVAALGAIGLEAMLECQRDADRKWQKRVLRGALTVAGILFIAWLAGWCRRSLMIWLMHDANVPTPAQLSAVRLDFLAAIFFVLVGTVLLGVAIYEKRSSRWVPGAVVALAFVNLWFVCRQVHVTMPGGIYTNRPHDVIDQLKKDPQFRVWTPYSAVAKFLYGEKHPELLDWARSTGGVTADWGLSGIYGCTPVGFGITRFSILSDTMGQASPAVQQKLGDILSVGQIVGGAPFDQVLWRGASRKLKVMPRLNSLPRAFLTTDWRTAPDQDAAFKTIVSDSFDPHREALVETVPGLPLPEAPVSGGSAGVTAVTSLVDRQESVSIEAIATQRSLLVFGDNWFPGWIATVDGVEKPIYRANFAFRGVFLDAGKHHVEFTYKPGSFRTGLTLAVISAAGCVFLGVTGRRNQPVGGDPERTSADEKEWELVGTSVSASGESGKRRKGKSGKRRKKKKG